jgi:glycosyltransferase involved in cell wall biosynthesis
LDEDAENDQWCWETTVYVLRIGIMVLFLLMWAAFTWWAFQNGPVDPAGGLAVIVMVKNEEVALPRLLDSLGGLASFTFVCDTGSTDGTMRVVADRAATVFQYIGEFHDFETSRNQCMDAARTQVPESVEWILLPDADFTLVGKPAFVNPDYDINIVRIEPPGGGGGIQNALPLLVRKSTFFNHCRYRLWTHEILDCCVGGGATTGYYNSPSFYFVDHSDGSNRPNKVKRDIGLLEEWLRLYGAKRDEPDWRNDLWARALYYLARAREDANDTALAVGLYEKHDTVQPWTNYRFYGRFRLALITLQKFREQNRSHAWPEVENAFVRAIDAPFGDGIWRREPYYYLTWFHCELHHWTRCWLWSKAALATPPIDYSRMPLFLEPALYDEAWFRGMAQRALGEIKMKSE